MKSGRRSTRYAKKAFTLLEIMLAVVLISIIAMGAAFFTGNSFNQLIDARERRAALSLAEHALEIISNCTPDRIDNSGDLRDSLTGKYIRFNEDTEQWYIVSGNNADYETYTLGGMEYDVFVFATPQKFESDGTALPNDFYYLDVNVNVRWRHDGEDYGKDLRGGISTRCRL